MANGRNRGQKGDSGRDAGGFVALPWSVLDCPAYAALSHPARALLFELARQFVRDNNGRLLCSMTYLGPRGWKSNDVITRAVRELVPTPTTLELGRKALITLGMHPHQAQRAQLHFRRLDMRMLRELMPVHTDTVQISRVREARRELEEIFQREMQKESRQLDGWDEFE